MRLALVFSGQGGLQPEHVDRLRQDAPPSLQALLAEPLAAVSAHADALTVNRYAQPLIFALQVLQWSAVRERLPRPVAAAGYSLGEMAACWAAGMFAAEPGVRLCGQRARHMDAAGGEGAMVALLGLDDGSIGDICRGTGTDIAIRNALHHVVLAGLPDAITQAVALAEAAGAARIVPLAVRTPSHTARLAPAGAALAVDLASEEIGGRLSFPVLSAIDGQPAWDAALAADALARQVCRPLDWARCMTTLSEMQPDAVLEIGPGNALCRLLAEIAPDLPARSCDEFRSPDGIVAWVLARG